jgi:hypothetical protein
MGAAPFTTRAFGFTANEAFTGAVREAQYESGHGGYTGTIAEKSSFKLLDMPSDTTPMEFVNKLFDEDDRRISDKWGPAGAVRTGKVDSNGRSEFIFFGYASE